MRDFFTLEFKDVNDLINKVLSPANSPFGRKHHSLIYRGESSLEFTLLPTALRLCNAKKLVGDAYTGPGVKGMERSNPYEINSAWEQLFHESFALRNFYMLGDRQGLALPSLYPIRQKFLEGDWKFWPDNVLEKVWLPDELRDLAALAQHYGVQTRLLDWSNDIFVALYFAASGVLRRYEEGELDKKDSMVLWVLNFPIDLSSLEDKKELPLALIRPPYSGNPNLAAQSGVFTLWEEYLGSNPDYMELHKTPVDRRPLDELLNEPGRSFGRYSTLAMYKCIIPATQCFALMDSLLSINYNASRIFPGYDGVARAMKERFLFDRMAKEFGHSYLSYSIY